MKFFHTAEKVSSSPTDKKLFYIINIILYNKGEYFVIKARDDGDYIM